MSAMHQEILKTNGTLADLPPPPSIAGLLEAASNHYREIREAEAQLAATAEQRSRAAMETRQAIITGKVPLMLEILRSRKGRWVATTDIRDEIVRTTGGRCDCGDICRALGRREVSEGIKRRDIGGRVHWRMG